MPLGLGIQLGLAQQNDVGVAAGPTITAAGSIDVSTFKIGATQTITAGTATATGGGTVSYEFQHLSDGEVKSTSQAYAHVSGDDTETGVAQWRAVESGGSNDGETSWQTVASGTITYNAPANTVAPVVSGGTGLNNVLSSTQGTWTGSGISYSYQWQRNTVDIVGETSSTYTIAQADDNASIRCVVTATNSGGVVATNSNAINADDFSIPVISGVPTISGTESVGQTLTATAAVVAGSPSPTRTWQWERSGVAISGATSSTYLLVAADEGETLTVVQTETNALGVDTAESLATGIIGSVSTGPFEILTDVALAGTGQAAQTLTITPPVYGGPNPTTIVYSTNGTNAVDVTNPSAPTLLVDAADAGEIITVVATVTQGGVDLISVSNGIFISNGSAAWSNSSWIEAGDLFTADFVNATRYDWALYNDADGQPSVSDGVWTGTVALSGGGEASTGSISINPIYPAGVSADRVIFVVSNGFSQDTEVYTFTARPLPYATSARWNADTVGNDVTAIDAGDDWIADIAAPPAVVTGTLANPANTYSGPASAGYDSSVDLSRVPTGVFDVDRFGPGQIQFTDIAPGNYYVTLLFMEQFENTVGNRPFSVGIEGTEVLTDWEPLQEVAKSIGIAKEFEVITTGKTLTVTLYSENFPIISGIEIREVT